MENVKVQETLVLDIGNVNLSDWGPHNSKTPIMDKYFLGKKSQRQVKFLKSYHLQYVDFLKTTLLYSQAFKCIIKNMPQTLLPLNDIENITFTSTFTFTHYSSLKN